MTEIDTRDRRIVSPITIDGGTRVRSRVPISPRSDLLAQLDAARVDRDRDGEATLRRHGGAVVDWVIDGTKHGSVARVRGSRRQLVSCLIADVAHVDLDLENNEAVIQAKARALWGAGAGTRGWRDWLSRVLSPISRQLFAAVEDHDLRELWRVCGAEICVDAIGVAFDRDDASCIVGARKGSTVAHAETSRHVETIAVGTRASPVSLCLYDKDREIAAKRKADYYGPVHVACGWDGRAPRWRLELRLVGQGLRWVADDTGEVLDLRDPMTLCDARQVRDVWRIVTAKRRLVVAGEASRRRRAATDPRWELYQQATGAEIEAWTWRQSRDVTDATYQERRDRARDRGLRGLIQLAVLQGLDREVIAIHEAIERGDVDDDDTDPIVGAVVATAKRALETLAARREIAAYGATYARTQRAIRDRIEDERAATMRAVAALQNAARMIAGGEPPKREPITHDEG